MVRNTDIKGRTRGAKTAIQGLSPGRQVEGARGTTTASLPQLRLRGLEGKKNPTQGQPTPGRALHPAKGPFWGRLRAYFTPLPPKRDCKMAGQRPPVPAASSPQRRRCAALLASVRLSPKK